MATTRSRTLSSGIYSSGDSGEPAQITSTDDTSSFHNFLDELMNESCSSLSSDSISKSVESVENLNNSKSSEHVLDRPASRTPAALEELVKVPSGDISNKAPGYYVRDVTWSGSFNSPTFSSPTNVTPYNNWHERKSFTIRHSPHGIGVSYEPSSLSFKIEDQPASPGTQRHLYRKKKQVPKKKISEESLPAAESPNPDGDANATQAPQDGQGAQDNQGASADSGEDGSSEGAESTDENKDEREQISYLDTPADDERRRGATSEAGDGNFSRRNSSRKNSSRRNSTRSSRRDTPILDDAKGKLQGKARLIQWALRAQKKTNPGGVGAKADDVHQVHDIENDSYRARAGSKTVQYTSPLASFVDSTGPFNQSSSAPVPPSGIPSDAHDESDSDLLPFPGAVLPGLRILGMVAIKATELPPHNSFEGVWHLLGMDPIKRFGGEVVQGKVVMRSPDGTQESVSALRHSLRRHLYQAREKTRTELRSQDHIHARSIRNASLFRLSNPFLSKANVSKEGNRISRPSTAASERSRMANYELHAASSSKQRSTSQAIIPASTTDPLNMPTQTRNSESVDKDPFHISTPKERSIFRSRPHTAPRMIRTQQSVAPSMTMSTSGNPASRRSSEKPLTRHSRPSSAKPLTRPMSAPTPGHLTMQRTNAGTSADGKQTNEVLQQLKNNLELISRQVEAAERMERTRQIKATPSYEKKKSQRYHDAAEQYLQRYHENRTHLVEARSRPSSAASKSGKLIRMRPASGGALPSNHRRISKTKVRPESAHSRAPIPVAAAAPRLTPEAEAEALIRSRFLASKLSQSRASIASTTSAFVSSPQHSRLLDDTICSQLFEASLEYPSLQEVPNTFSSPPASPKLPVPAETHYTTPTHTTPTHTTPKRATSHHGKSPLPASRCTPFRHAMPHADNRLSRSPLVSRTRPSRTGNYWKPTEFKPRDAFPQKL